jgi:transposase
MSHSLIYRELGVYGYRHVRARKERDGLHLTICQDRSRYRCSRCGSTKVHGKGSRPRSFRAPSIGQKPTWIDLDVPVVLCRSCHVEAQVRVPFAEPLKRYTRLFARQVLSLVEIATTQDVARHLGVSWHLVRSIEQDHLEKHFSKPKLRSLQTIAIDEIYSGKKGKYLTIALDLQSGAIVYVGEGKDAAALDDFWKRLRASRARIEAVAIDMSKAYVWAVRQHLKEAVVVFDHFHVIKLYNDKLTNLRRQLYREAKGLLQRNVLKGIRWLLLKNKENLDEAKRERQRLEAALELNAPLATAYYLKEWLHEIWNQKCKADAAAELEEWLQAAESTGIRVLTQFAKTLRTYRTGILNYYDYRISTGPLEGTNNKIKTLTRSAYGYREKEYFKLKLFALHQTRYRLVG